MARFGRAAWWSEVRDHRVETTKLQVMPGLWTTWSTPLFHMTQNQQSPPVSMKFRAQTVSFTSLMMALSRGESLRLTDEQSSNTSGKRRERWQTRTAAPHYDLQKPRDITAGGESPPRHRPSYQHLVLEIALASSLTSCRACTQRLDFT